MFWWRLRSCGRELVKRAVARSKERRQAAVTFDVSDSPLGDLITTGVVLQEGRWCSSMAYGREPVYTYGDNAGTCSRVTLIIADVVRCDIRTRPATPSCCATHLLAGAVCCCVAVVRLTAAEKQTPATTAPCLLFETEGGGRTVSTYYYHISGLLAGITFCLAHCYHYSCFFLPLSHFSTQYIYGGSNCILQLLPQLKTADVTGPATFHGTEGRRHYCEDCEDTQPTVQQWSGVHAVKNRWRECADGKDR